MAGYKEIKGFHVQTRSEDPTPYAQALADNPYVGSWSTKSNMNSSTGGVSGSGTTSATIAAGGYPGNDRAETWDGSSWTEVNEINTARGNAGATGTGSTASVLFGGRTAPGALSALNESWNGSNWTEVGDLNTASRQMAYFGTQTAAIKADGIPYPTNSVESWNGSAWSETTENNTARQSLAGSSGSPYTNGLIFGGYTTTYVANAETWNGSTWTETGDLNTARAELGGAGSSSTNAIGYAGETSPGAMTQTESWDGSSWSEVNEVNTARYQVGYSGSSNASALLFGGLTPSATNATELWAFSGLPPSTPAADYADAIVGDFYYNSSTGQFKTVNDGGAPIGSWSSGGNLNTARYGTMSGGNTTAAIAAVGNTDGTTEGYTSATESYDGSSWSEVAEANTTRAFGASGTQTPATAAIIFGGGTVPTAYSADTETWNGTSWTEVNNLNTARGNLMGAGSASTAAIAATGSPGPITSTESWDGSSWTEIAEISNARPEGGSGTGTSTAAFIIGGSYPGGNRYALVEEWDGSSWTETGDINTARAYMSSAGSVTDSIIGGGNATAPVGYFKALTEGWNGTTWTEVSDMATGRYGGNTGTGTGGTNLLVAGGETSPTSRPAATEEWTAADFQIKSVTTS